MFRSEESEQLGGDLVAVEPVVPAAMATSWRAAEAELFTVLLGRPDVYEAVIVLVGATADLLRRLGPSTRALQDAAATITALVAEAAAVAPATVNAIDPDLVGRAALALRHREVMVEQAALRRRDLLAAARAKTAGWVVLEEAGEWAGDPLAPYRRLEAHATTGEALLVTAVPDDDFRTSRHEVDVLSVDLDTGRLSQSTARGGEPLRAADAAAREVQATTLRERLAGSG